MRASSQGGFSITLSMPSAAARATTAGDSEPVISRTGMPMPRARNVSTSSRPVIFGIWLSRIRHAGLCIAVFRNSAAEANVSTGCPITSSRNRNESRTSGSSSTTATAQWSTSFKTLFAVAQGPRACRELPYRLAPDERGVATARPVLERAGASASSLPISAWSRSIVSCCTASFMYSTASCRYAPRNASLAVISARSWHRAAAARNSPAAIIIVAPI